MNTKMHTDGSANICVFFEKMEETIELFNEIFYNIAPTKKLNQLHLQESDRFDRSALSDRQCNAIKQLSGKMSEIQEFMVDTQLRNSPKFNTMVGNFEKRKIYYSDKITARRISLLQEYLSQELDRSENLEFRLKEKEEELVDLQAQLNRLTKRTPKTTASSVTESVKSVEEEDPTALVRCFVRKQFGKTFFFGLVIKHLNPWFRVVYEDADSEDLAKSDVKRLLWDASVPSSKSKACYQHAKNMGLLEEKTHPAIEPSVENPLYLRKQEQEKPTTVRSMTSEEELSVPVTESSHEGTSNNSVVEKKGITPTKLLRNAQQFGGLGLRASGTIQVLSRAEVLSDKNISPSRPMSEFSSSSSSSKVERMIPPRDSPDFQTRQFSQGSSPSCAIDTTGIQKLEGSVRKRPISAIGSEISTSPSKRINTHSNDFKVVDLTLTDDSSSDSDVSIIESVR